MLNIFLKWNLFNTWKIKIGNVHGNCLDNEKHAVLLNERHFIKVLKFLCLTWRHDPAASMRNFLRIIFILFLSFTFKQKRRNKKHKNMPLFDV